MRIIKVTLLTGIIAFLFFSCNHGFLKDPRLYNAKKKTQDTNMSVAPEPELDLTGGIDAFDDLEQWYNKSDEGFLASDFDTMSLVGTYFDNSNVPQYAMESGDVWVSNDTTKAEYVHAKAPDTTGQGYGISNVYWYQYRGRNPLYATDGSYNTQLQSTSKGNPKLNRFYFYRFTGDTLSPSLDNFLFAVDTYSKLMFAFAYPTKTENVFGNNVPKAWGPTDGSPFLGTNYQFYMYDPVGYVEKVDDQYNVVMYDWFKNNLAKGIYQPTLGGLNDKSQGTPYSEVAKKSPSGQGTSPFNNNSVDFFKENMKLLSGATFQRRETLADGSNGLVLYKYTVDKDATKITRTAESWNDLPTTTSLDPVIYTIGDGENATKGILTDDQGKKFSFELADETRTLTIAGGSTPEVAVRNFSDLGPDFIHRVAHEPFYKSSDGSITYTFKDKGKTLVFVSDGKSYNYTYEQPRNDTNRNCAVYGSKDAALYYAGFELRNQDSTITASRTSGAWAGTFAWDMTYEAHLTYETGTTFKETVKGKTFSYRKSNDSGYDLTLMTLKFSADGSTATLSETKWGGDAVDTGTSLTVADGTNANAGKLNEQDVTLITLNNGQWQLKYQDSTYFLRYEDPGPSFVNRVRDGNPTFVSSNGDTVYRFSNFGKTLRMTYTGGWLGMGNFDYTYEFVQEKETENSSTSKAVYKAKDGIAGFSYAGFQLSNSDMQIQASRTSGSGAGGFVWDMTYDANRNGDISSVPTEEDLKAFYDYINGKSFKNRNVENGVAGLELYTWSFDTSKDSTLKKQVYPANTESTPVTIPSGKLVATSKTSGTFLTQDNKRYNFSYDNESNTLFVEAGSDSLSYSLNYDDKGPGFINRVKGKTFVEDGKTVETGYSYTFSADGTICTYKNPNANIFQTKSATYNYEPNNDKGTSGKYVYAVYGGFFVDLCDGNDGRKDSVFRMENTKAASDYWAADMEWEAILLP